MFWKAQLSLSSEEKIQAFDVNNEITTMKVFL